MLVIVSFVSYLLRGNLSIAAPTMIADLHLTEIQWGWVMAASARLCPVPVSGRCMGRAGRAAQISTIIAAAWAVLILVTSVVPAQGVAPVFLILGTLVIVQFLVGAFHAPVFPVVSLTIGRWFPVGGWAFPNGLTSSGLTLGLAATASALPWLMSLYGWRWSFIILAPFGIAAAGIWWWYGRDNPAEHPAVNAAEVELIAPQAIEHITGESREPGWLRVLKNRDVLLLTLSYSSMNFVFYVVFSWGFYYLGDAAWLRRTGSGLSHVRTVDRRRLWRSTGWMVMRPAMPKDGSALGMPHHHSHRHGGFGGTVARRCLPSQRLCGRGHARPVFFLQPAHRGTLLGDDHRRGGRHAGAAGGLMNTGANLMGFVNALLLSVVADSFGWTVAIAIGSVFALVGAGLILLVRADRLIDQSP